MIPRNLIFQASLLFCLAMICPASAQSGPRWHNPLDSPIELNGLPFLLENGGRWWRFPRDVAESIPDYVWETSKLTSGARIRFSTNATELRLRAKIGEAVTHANTSLYGAAAFDLYIDQQYATSHVPETTGEFEATLFNTAQPRWREVTIYLPLFAESEILAIGINPGAEIAAPQPFAHKGRVIFYGTSITHGGCASRAGLSYPAQVCRMLNLDFVNFGLNGCGRGEAAVARILARIPNPAAFVLDYAQNNQSTESLAANYAPFIRILRESHPDTPILCTTPIYWTPELPTLERGSNHEKMRDVIRAAVSEFRKAGDQNIFIVEGYDLLGPSQSDGLIDGLHPNSHGFSMMAHGLSPALEKAIHLR